MSHLLDTDVIIGYLKGERGVVDLLNALPQAHTTHINLAELFYGAYKSDNRRKHLEKLVEFMRGVELVGMSPSSSEIYGRVKNTLEAAGRSAGDFDILIASVCLANNLTLVTGNGRHYQGIPGLKVHPAGLR